MSISRTDASGTSNFLADALGSTIGLTDTSGNSQVQYSYGPFGAINITGTTNSTYTYTGREIDGLGLYYYRARYYNPATGRFISEDPIGLRGGINEYSYVGDSPLNFVDPFGMDKGPQKRNPCRTGFGFGVQGGGDTALGGGYAGTAGTAGVGGGLFFGGNQLVSAGGYASGGATAYAGSHVRNAPAPTMGPPTSVGAGVGPLGGGVFVTNASSASQLRGPFLTFGGAVGLDVSLGAQVSIGYDAAGNFIWQAQLSGGLGWGLYGYALTTNTKAVATGDECE